MHIGRQSRRQKPNAHRQRRRDATVELSRVDGVYRAKNTALSALTETARNRPRIDIAIGTGNSRTARREGRVTCTYIRQRSCRRKR